VISHWPPRRICALLRTCKSACAGRRSNGSACWDASVILKRSRRPPRDARLGADSNIRRGSGRSRRGVVLHGRGLAARAGEAGCSGAAELTRKCSLNHLPALTVQSALFASIWLSVQQPIQQPNEPAKPLTSQCFPQYQLANVNTAHLRLFWAFEEEVHILVGRRNPLAARTSATYLVQTTYRHLK